MFNEVGRRSGTAFTMQVMKQVRVEASYGLGMRREIGQ
jgi:hypothetical protein